MNTRPDDKDDDADDAALLLPWYATGRLDEADRRRVERYLEEHPEERAHLAVVEEELAQTERLNRELPGHSGVDAILSSIRGSENRRPVARTGSGMTRLLAKLGEWVDNFAPPVRGAAVAALLVLLAVQAGAIGALLRAPEGAEFRTASGEIVTAARPSLLVMFAPDASAAEITALLETLDARIVDGPRAGGNLRSRPFERRRSGDGPCGSPGTRRSRRLRGGGGMSMRRIAAAIALTGLALLMPPSNGGTDAQTRIAPPRMAPPSITAPPPRIAPAPRPSIAPRIVPRSTMPRPMAPGTLAPRQAAPGPDRIAPAQPQAQPRTSTPAQQRTTPRNPARAVAEPPRRGPIPPPRPGSFAAPEPIPANIFDPDAFANSEILMTMRTGFARNDAAAIAADNDLTIVEAESIGLIDALVLRLRIDDGRSLDAVIALLADDPRVAYAGRNRIFQSQGQTSNKSPQYALARLEIPAAHELATGSGVTIAVIDTAADLVHPALADARIRTTSLRDDAAASDHATQIIGLIAAGGLLLGAAPGADILSLPAFIQDSEGSGSSSTTMFLLRALDLADRAGARVVNMSFAGGDDRLLAAALDALDANGAVLVAASGNGGPDAAPAFPASHAAVIAVTAVDAAERLYAMANRGAYVEIAAPGVDLLAPAVGRGYSLATGTSHATAYVSAAAALMLEMFPDATTAEVRTGLRASAIDLGPAGPDSAFGAGRVAPLAALRGMGAAVLAGEASDRRD